MKIGFLVTARMQSSRLPKKVLLEVRGKPFLAHLFDRIKLCSSVNQLVLCTSVNKENDVLEKFANQYGIDCFRGDEEDVIKRLYEAAVKYQLDYILHITGDCPLVDPYYADKIVEEYLNTGADLITAFDLPHGAYSYGINPLALKKIIEIKDANNTEVWGRYFTDTDLFNVSRLEIKSEHKRPELRMTLDYEEDYEFFKKIFSGLESEGKTFSLDELLNYLDRHPEIAAINAHCEKKYKKRWNAQSYEIALKPRYSINKALIVGLGSIGQRHLKNLQSLGIEKIAALRTKKGFFQSLREESTIQEFYSWDEVAHYAPDVAIIANPTAMHYETIKKLVGIVKKGIFIEKPASHSLEGISKLWEKITQNKLVTFVGYNMQFHPMIRKISEIIHSGQLGEPLSFQGCVGHWLPDWHPYEDYRNSYAARNELGGGVTLTLIHEIEMAVSWFGVSKDSVIFRSKSEKLSLDVDVISDLMIQHRSGVVSQLHLDFIQARRQRMGVIWFELGYLKYDLVKQTLVMFSKEEADEQSIWTKPSYNTNDMYIDMMKLFLQYVSTGRVSNRYDLSQSISCLKIASEAVSCKKRVVSIEN